MMRTVRTNPIVVWILAAALVGGNVSLALAVDGVVLIDQNRALAGNVTPGDAPGFPVTLSRAGSYRLSGNLTVPNENTTAIQITAGNVTLDLNGFSILGPTVCSGSPTTCTPTGSGFGVRADNDIDRTTVVNGTVQGMGSTGLILRGVARVENVHAVSNGGGGFTAGESSTVSGNTATDNRGAGITAGSGSTVSGNTAQGNGGEGIISGAGCTVSGNTSWRNSGNGIRSGGGTVSGNTATDNGLSGIRSGTATVSGNTATGDNFFGLVNESLVSAYTHNVLVDNSSGAVIGGVSLGQNLCDGVIC